MKPHFEKYFSESIGENIKIEPWAGQRTLPLLFNYRYRFFQTEILGVHCLLTEPLEESAGIIVLQKQMKMLSRYTDLRIVLFFKTISRYKRKQLITNRMPFLIENGQMYLPFLGLDIKEDLKSDVEESEKFTGLMQLVYLMFLYAPETKITATELANQLGCSPMHAVRALSGLYERNLIVYNIGGKTSRGKYYHRIGDPEYYQKGLRYLENPIMRTEHTETILQGYPSAGLDALSQMSMINPYDYSEQAVGKAEALKIKGAFVKEPGRIKDEKLPEIQIWRYDPTLLSKDRCVDIVSLSLTLRDLHDERVDQAISERFKGEPWYCIPMLQDDSMSML